MKRLLCAAVVLALAPLARGAEEAKENPYKKAKVGDWVEYKIVSTFGDMKIDGTVKVTVTDKTDKEVTLKSVPTVNGMEAPATETKVDLTKPFDPLATGTLPQGAEAKVEKTGEGKEKIRVGGKEYDCEWVKMKISGKSQGIEFTGDAKVWTSPTLPLGGVAKTDMNMKVLNMDVNMTMEYAGSGSK
jgi:hypothetical protein